jgi:hypothetical protein
MRCTNGAKLSFLQLYNNDKMMDWTMETGFSGDFSYRAVGKGATTAPTSSDSPKIAHGANWTRSWMLSNYLVFYPVQTYLREDIKIR